MKKITTIRNVAAAVMGMLLFPGAGYSQSCDANKVTLTLTAIDLKSTAVEFDINISNTSPGGNSLKLASLSGALIYDGKIADGKFTVVTQPSETGFSHFTNVITLHSGKSSQLRWMSNPVAENMAADLPLGATKKFARFRFEPSNGKLPADFISKLKFQEYVQKGYTAVNANVYCNGNSSSTALANGKGTASKGISNGSIEVKINPSSAALTGIFTATPYPNPFTGTFQLNIQSGSEDDIQLRVYDMLGKLVEDSSFTTSAIKTTVIGANYPSGIYNLKLLQAGQTQTMRIIKK